MSMEQGDPYAKHYQYGISEDYGRGVGIVVSVVLHLGVIAAMLFVRPPAKPDFMRNAISVTLAGAPMSPTAGKERKAAVKRSTTATKKTNKKKTRKKTTKKPSKDAVGLNTKKTEKKTKPEPAETTPDPGPPADEPADLGGLGGADESGIAFDISSASRDIEFKDIEFIDYYRTVYAEIFRRWSKGGLTGGQVSVRFRIMRDGEVQGTEIAESSGKRYLDSPAMRAVMGARFPPLPQGYHYEVMPIRINFIYHEEN